MLFNLVEGITKIKLYFCSQAAAEIMAGYKGTEISIIIVEG